MLLSKKFLISFAIVIFSVVPAYAGDRDRCHWQSAKMLNLTANQKTEWAQLKRAHLENMRTSARDLRLAYERLQIAFQSSTGEDDGLISRHKGEIEIRKQATAWFSIQQENRSNQLEYQIAVWRILTPDQRLLVGIPNHRLLSMDRNKGSWLHRVKGRKEGWGQGYRGSWNKRHGMAWDKGTGNRRGQSHGDSWKKNRKRKLFN